MISISTPCKIGEQVILRIVAAAGDYSLTDLHTCNRRSKRTSRYLDGDGAGEGVEVLEQLSDAHLVPGVVMGHGPNGFFTAQ